jgi:hypothetical protein
MGRILPVNTNAAAIMIGEKAADLLRLVTGSQEQGARAGP